VSFFGENRDLVIFGGLGVFVGLPLLIFLWMVFRGLKAANAEEQRRAGLLTTGLRGEAKIIQLHQVGTASEGEAIYLELVLDVTVETAGAVGSPFRVKLETRIPTIAVPRVQPDASIPVRCNPARLEDLVLDLPALGFT
jgi:hypothetical protein